MRCRCAPCKRRAVEASRSRLAHAGPHSTGESLACSYAPGRRSPSEHEVRSPPPAPPPTSLGAPLPAAACASPGSHAPPPGRRVLCQLATHGIDCPRLPRLERVAFTAWQGRGARHPRRFADPARARVSLLGSPSGAASILKEFSLHLTSGKESRLSRFSPSSCWEDQCPPAAPGCEED